MVKEALSEMGLEPIAVAGLVTFFATFVGISVWTFTRRSRQVAAWSSLPLVDGREPVEHRHGRDEPDDHEHEHRRDGNHECRNCGECKCKGPGEPAVVSLS